MSFLSNINLPELLLSIPCILIALTVHEVSHGFIAYKLGDPTARNLGRLTLNPLKHLDPIGAICMLVFHFGWAKPVPVNTRYFKKPRRDMALTALAGPVSNIILAFIGRILFHITLTVANYSALTADTAGYAVIALITLFNMFSVLNVGLALFNLIPVPPLDGSRIFFVFLPPRAYFAVMKYERYISLAILVLFWTGIITLPLNFLATKIITGMDFIIGLVPFLY